MYGGCTRYVTHKQQLNIADSHWSEETRNTGAGTVKRAHAYLGFAALAAQQRVALREFAPVPAGARVLRLALRALRVLRILRDTCTWCGQAHNFR